MRTNLTRIWLKFSLLAVFIVLIACSRGKKSNLNVNTDKLSSSILKTEKNDAAQNKQQVAFLDGPALYAKNCATCHGVLEQSAKKNKTPANIKGAIASITQMAHLKSLTADEIDLISQALQAGPTLSATGGGNPFQCTADSKSGSKTPFKRLTRNEFVNVYRDLFADLVPAAALKEATDGFPDDGFDGVFSNKVNTKTYSNVFGMYAGADVIANLLPKSNAFLTRFGPCGSPDDACATNIINNFGKRALRRPLIAGEADRYLGLYRDTGKGVEGLSAMLFAVLQSPSFVYRIESGAGAEQSDGSKSLSAFELASKLSFVMAETLPDSVLWAKAVDGSILKNEVYLEQVNRIAASPQFKNRVLDFFRGLSGVSKPASLSYAPYFLSGLDGKKVTEEARAEFDSFIADIVFDSKLGYGDLITSNKAVAMGSQVAAIYSGDELKPVMANLVSTMNASPGLSFSWKINEFSFSKNPVEQKDGVAAWTPHGGDALAKKTFKWSPSGDAKFSFETKGEALNSVFPNLIIRIVKVGVANPINETKIVVNWTDKKVHSLNSINLPEGDYEIQLSSDNDESNAQGDRNVWIYSADVTGSGGQKSDVVIPGPVALPATGTLAENRAGLFGRVAFLQSGDNVTHLVHRGLKVRKNFLCEEIKPPDATTGGVEAGDLTPPMPRADKSMMLQIKDKTTRSPCSGCHNNINPPGFVLEEFDGLGRHRNSEIAFDISGKILAQHPIKVSMRPNIETPDEPLVESVKDFALAMKQSSKAPACFAQRWFEYAHQRAPKALDSCFLKDLYSVLQDSGARSEEIKSLQAGQIQSMFIALLLSNEFKIIRK